MTLLDDLAKKRASAKRKVTVIINQLEPRRWQQVRPPNQIERKATALMKLTIREGAFKSRTGGPNEEPEDLDLPRLLVLRLRR